MLRFLVTPVRLVTLALALVETMATSWVDLGQGYCRCASGDPRLDKGFAMCEVVGRAASSAGTCKDACDVYEGSTCLGCSWAEGGKMCLISINRRLDSWSPAVDYDSTVIADVGIATQNVTCYSRFVPCPSGSYAPIGRNSSFGDCQPCPPGSTSHNVGSTWCTCQNETEYWDFTTQKCVASCANQTVVTASSYCDVCPPGTAWSEPNTCVGVDLGPMLHPIMAAILLGALCFCCATAYSRYRRRQLAATVVGGSLAIYRSPDGSLVYAALPSSDDVYQPVVDATGRVYEPVGYSSPPLPLISEQQQQPPPRQQEEEGGEEEEGHMPSSYPSPPRSEHDGPLASTINNSTNLPTSPISRGDGEQQQQQAPPPQTGGLQRENELGVEGDV